MTALEQLVERIRQARGLGLLPAEWEVLAEAALAEHAVGPEWETESEFRLRTGSGQRWCQRNFARCEARGLARRAGGTPRGNREWHIHARAPRGRAADDLVKQIRESFNRRTA